MEKQQPSSFAGTDLHAYLQKKGAKKLVLTGYMVRRFFSTTAFPCSYLSIALSAVQGFLDFSSRWFFLVPYEFTAASRDVVLLVQMGGRMRSVFCLCDWIGL